MLTQEQLKELFHYSPETGIFTRLKTTTGKNKAGTIPGGDKSTGYIRIAINGKYYQAHRLAWLYMTGDFPKNCIDHINMIKTDNSWGNLRGATRSENNKNRNAQSNNRLQLKNISKLSSGSYRVQVGSNGSYINKTFKKLEEAISYAKEMRDYYHKEFSRN